MYTPDQPAGVIRQPNQRPRSELQRCPTSESQVGYAEERKNFRTIEVSNNTRSDLDGASRDSSASSRVLVKKDVKVYRAKKSGKKIKRTVSTYIVTKPKWRSSSSQGDILTIDYSSAN